jgi:hypothetical protein
MLESTQQAIDANLTLDSDESALSRLRKEVLDILDAHKQTNQSFQEEVKLALQRMVVQREEAARSTTHGLIFEDVVCEFLSREAQKLGDIATRTGETTGLIKGCKVGDCLLELSPESAAPGARIVAEAKEKAQFALSKAREEIEKARDNRGAQVGLFIYSARTAPVEFQASPLQRYGSDVFVAWDPEDPSTDLALRIACTLARALCIRVAQHSAEQSADFEAVDAAILEVERQTNFLSAIENAAGDIQRGSEAILDRVRITRKSLTKQVELLREKMQELKALSGEGSEVQ